MAFEKTCVEVFGITILEPVTTVTDLMVSAVCLYAFLKLQTSGKKETIYAFLKYYFLAMSVATALGGIIGHAFLYKFSFEWKVPAWMVSMLSIAIFERAAIMHARPLLKPAVGKFFLALNVAELITLIIITLYTLNFFFVEVHAAYGLVVVVFSFELFVFLKTKDPGSRLMLIGVVISGLAAAVHLSEFILHKWFNHLDLGHVLMTLAAYVFYRGAIAMKVNG